MGEEIWPRQTLYRAACPRRFSVREDAPKTFEEETLSLYPYWRKPAAGSPTPSIKEYGVNCSWVLRIMASYGFSAVSEAFVYWCCAGLEVFKYGRQKSRAKKCLAAFGPQLQSPKPPSTSSWWGRRYRSVYAALGELGCTTWRESVSKKAVKRRRIGWWAVPLLCYIFGQTEGKSKGADTAPLVGTWVIGSARVSRRLKDREARCLPYLPLLPHPSSEPKEFGKWLGRLLEEESLQFLQCTPYRPAAVVKAPSASSRNLGPIFQKKLR